MSMPFVVSGTVTDSSDNVVKSTTIVVRNDNTNETINATTNTSGQYIVDLANLASGYLETDSITIYCVYASEYAESSFLVSDDTHEVNLTLVAIEDSELIYYCTVQDVWDELDEKTASNISAHRIVKLIQRAESEIEEQTAKVFRTVTFTDEIFDYNQYTTYKSAEQLRYVNTIDRHDYWNVYYNDTIKLHDLPIISITSLYKNTASPGSADDWSELTEQEGSSGNFLIYKKEGLIKFIVDKPRYGKRALKVSGTYGYATTPKIVSRLTILLAVRDVILSKMSGSQFNNQKTIAVDGLMIQGGVSAGGRFSYMDLINKEIDRCWARLGSFRSDVV